MKPEVIEARQLARELIRLTDGAEQRRAKKLYARLKVDMAAVVKRIPGTTMKAKAKEAHVSRQTLYYWINGETRPNKKQARRIAFLTGLDPDAIRGLVPET